MKDVITSVRAFALSLSAILLVLSLPSTGSADPYDGQFDGDEYSQSSWPSSWMESDACDPDLQPFEVGMMGSHSTYDCALDVAVSNGYAFVADGLSGLQILDVREPNCPSLVATYNTPGYAQGVAVVGNFAFIADGAGGLQVVDVSAPSSPAPAGNCDTGGFAYGVAVSGDYAYVGRGAGGLGVVDVSDPRSPALVGHHDVCSTAWGVAVSGDYVYVAGGASGLQIIDASNPFAPAHVACYETRCTALGVSVSNGYAFVAGGSDGLHIISIHDPYSPMLVAKCKASEFAYGVAMINNYAYVAAGASGLQVLQARANISLDDPRSGPPTGLSNPTAEGGGSESDRLDGRELYQNSPNPFRSTTQIAFSMEKEAHVRLGVFDMSGRLVRTLVDETRSPNRYVEDWDGTDAGGRTLPAGMYFYRIELPGWVDARKMTLTR